MNIFALHKDPQICAEYHCDKHVVKMIVETAQMISTTFEHYGEHKIYMLKPVFKNHPCTIWARQSYENLHWLIGLGYFLCKEYSKRYDKKHKYDGEFYHAVMKDLHFIEKDRFPEQGLTQFYCAMPDDCKIIFNGRLQPIASYRNYYRNEKRSICKWKLGNVPTWFE